MGAVFVVRVGLSPRHRSGLVSTYRATGSRDAVHCFLLTGGAGCNMWLGGRVKWSKKIG
jgi:hypothetical protein